MKKRASAKSTRGEVDHLRRAVTGEPPSERHLEVLRLALDLISERGYAGASLRELARRFGVSQPSLYHYFRSKEELVEQIISHLGPTMLASLAPGPLPQNARDLPRYLTEFLVGLYRDETYPRFVRFIFLTALEQPQHRKAVRRLYTEQSDQLMRIFLQPYADRGEIALDDTVRLLSLLVRGIGLAFIEERVLYANPKAADLLKPLTDYAVTIGETMIESGKRRRSK